MSDTPTFNISDPGHEQPLPPSVHAPSGDETADAMYAMTMDTVAIEQEIDSALAALDGVESSHENTAPPAEMGQWKEALRAAKMGLATPGGKLAPNARARIHTLCTTVIHYAQIVAKSEYAREEDEEHHYRVAIEASKAAAHSAAKAAAHVLSVFSPSREHAMLKEQHAALEHAVEQEEKKQQDHTIERDLQQDFSDHKKGTTRDSRGVEHAVLTGKTKKAIVAAVPTGVAAKSINAVAQAASSVGAFGMDEHASHTASALTNTAINGKTAVEREVAVGEMVDAAARRVTGRTFVGQEIDDALGDLEKMGYTDKIGGIGSSITGLRTSDVMAQLAKNGWTTDRWTFFSSNASNSEWSEDTRKRLDRNHDGQISTTEIKFALDHTKRSVDIQQGIEKMKQKADDVGDKAADITAGSHGLGKQLKNAVAGFQQYKFTYDTDHDGKAELHEIVKVLKGKGINSVKDMNGDHKIDVNDVDAMIRGKKPAVAAAKGH